jgi:hypothetical protein
MIGWIGLIMGVAALGMNIREALQARAKHRAALKSSERR